MEGTRQAGYTVIEVTLFLAVSGLLFLIAVLGTSGTIRSVRFSDSGRSLAAFVQKQYDDIINGVNTRSGNEECAAGTVSPGSQQPGTSECLLMGTLLVMRQNQTQIQVYDVVGTEPATLNLALPDAELIASFQPKAVPDSGVSTYNIPWGAFISGSKRSDGQAASALLLIRSPQSSRIVSYTYKVPTPVSADLVDADGDSVLDDTDSIGQQTNFCIKNADGLGSPAMLSITGGTNQSAAQILFDRDDGDCDGV